MRTDRRRCLFCGRWFRAGEGALPRHAVGSRPCLGSGRAVHPRAFGEIRARIEFGGTPCAACGQPVRVLTLHNGVHAAWPCGDAFAVQPYEQPHEEVTPVVVPEQTRRLSPFPLVTCAGAAG